MDDDKRQRIALWHLGVLGPLISARLKQGDVSVYVRQAAERLHRMPDGRQVRLSESTEVVSHQAAEMLFRASRLAARLTRSALRIAQERGQTFLDESMAQLALDEMAIP